VTSPSSSSASQPTLASPSNGAGQSSSSAEPPPSLPRTTEHPVEGAQPQSVTPEPGSDAIQKDPYDVKKTDPSTMFEAPKLFNPKDRTAQRSIAPVRTAIYEQPATYHKTSTAPRGPVSDEQARIDAIGWTSGAK
jgi:hypothetical protein